MNGTHSRPWYEVLLLEQQTALQEFAGICQHQQVVIQELQKILSEKDSQDPDSSTSSEDGFGSGNSGGDNKSQTTVPPFMWPGSITDLAKVSLDGVVCNAMILTEDLVAGLNRNIELPGKIRDYTTAMKEHDDGLIQISRLLRIAPETLEDGSRTFGGYEEERIFNRLDLQSRRKKVARQALIEIGMEAVPLFNHMYRVLEEAEPSLLDLGSYQWASHVLALRMGNESEDAEYKEEHMDEKIARQAESDRSSGSDESAKSGGHELSDGSGYLKRSEKLEDEESQRKGDSSAVVVSEKINQ